MNEFSHFFFLQKRMLFNRMQTWREHSRFKIFIVSLSALIFWASIFVFFYRGLLFFEHHIPHDFFALMLDYIFAIFYFALLLMLTFSATIIAFSVFFHARETGYLFTCPLSLSGIFTYKFLETFIFASWAIFFLGLPICFAYGIQQGVSWLYYPLLVVLYVPFISIPALLGALIAFIIILYLLKIRRVVIFSTIILGLFAIIMLGVSIASLKNEVPAFTAAWFLGLLDYLNFARYPLLPSLWIGKAMFALAQRDYAEYFFQLLLLTSTALFLGTIAYLLAALAYDKALSIAYSHRGSKSFKKLSWLKSSLRLFFFLKPHDRLFLEKEVKTFIRDPLQWGQFGILLGLLFLYILNLRTLRYDQQIIFWKHIIATLNLTATSLTICTFASRFIFPLLSLEGKRFWMLGVMPVKRSRILLAKFVFAVVTLFVTSEILIIFSCYMLRLPWPLTLLYVVTMLAITLGVAGLSVGLGAIYPNFNEDSPAKIVSGFGGTLNLVLNLFFVLLIVVLQFVPSHFVLKGQASVNMMFFWIAIGAIVTALACISPLYFGIRSFSKMEI